MMLWVHCLKHGCRHNAQADLDALCAGYGDGMPVSVFVALSRCSRCGARWPDLAITLTPPAPQVVSHGKSGRVQPPA